MPLFQQSVLKKYISDIDKAQLQNAWHVFQQHSLMQIYSRTYATQEEEYQEGFKNDQISDISFFTSIYINPVVAQKHKIEKIINICIALDTGFFSNIHYINDTILPFSKYKYFVAADLKINANTYHHEDKKVLFTEKEYN